MASGNVSSKKKSSSSHKKKLSKKSYSEAKKRKRSRSRKIEKSKKMRRRDVSVSSSDDDSRSGDSLSSSSFDSGDDYRPRRKVRSRTRGNKKKKVKRSLLIRDENSELRVRRKRKGSKRSDGLKVKKKSRLEKNRRDVSVDLRSCSTCNEDSEVESLRGRAKVREKVEVSDGSDRYRSVSLFPCSGDSEHGRYRNEEILVSVNKSRRLKSVLAVPDECEDGGRYQSAVPDEYEDGERYQSAVPDEYEDEGRYRSKNENTAEIIHAYDDCPSCKSDDSYDGERKKEFSYQAYDVPEKKKQVDGGRKKESSSKAYDVLEKRKLVHDGKVEVESRKESSHLLNVVSEKKMQTENVKNGDVLISKTKITECTQSSKGDVEGQHDKMILTANTDSTKTASKTEVSGGIVISEVGDLEIILRQKALENFRKFRGVRQANATLTDSVKNSFTSEDEPIKSESSKEADKEVAGAKDLKSSEMENITTTIKEGILITSSAMHGIITSDGKPRILESIDTRCENDRVVDGKASEKKIVDLGTIRNPNQRSLVYRRETSGDHAITKQAAKTQDNFDGKSREAKSITSKIVPEPHKATVGASGPQKSMLKEIPVAESPKHAVQIPDGNIKRGGYVDTRHGDDRVGDVNATERKIINLGAFRKPYQGSLVYRRESSGDGSIRKQASKLQEGSDGKSQETEKTANTILPEPPKAAVGSSDPHKIDTVPGSSTSETTSSLAPATGKNGSKESGNATSRGPEFEQKTMSVTRGGESVQVSYKVYIPKKNPALARRQLKR